MLFYTSLHHQWRRGNCPPTLKVEGGGGGEGGVRGRAMPHHFYTSEKCTAILYVYIPFSYFSLRVIIIIPRSYMICNYALYLPRSYMISQLPKLLKTVSANVIATAFLKAQSYIHRRSSCFCFSN